MYIIWEAAQTGLFIIIIVYFLRNLEDVIDDRIRYYVKLYLEEKDRWARTDLDEEWEAAQRDLD